MASALLSWRTWSVVVAALARTWVVALLLAAAAGPAQAGTWAERLGWPAGSRVLILHADDVGMCYEANEATKDYLSNDQIQSGALMVPCPWYNEMAEWYRDHPDHDLGLHLALTSEWQNYRWGPVADRALVKGLIDGEGYMPRSVVGVVLSARPEEVEAELRAQIEKALRSGPKPGHIDTHMGTLYARPDYTRVYLDLAQEYRIPAMVVEQSPEVVEKFRKQGYPLSDAMIEVINDYKLPKLDDFHAAPEGKTYDEKRDKFFELVRSFRPGVNEVIFHPSVETECLKKITNSWQQRVWEAQMFADPAVRKFLEREGVQFTNWKDIMRRFDERGGDGGGASSAE